MISDLGGNQRNLYIQREGDGTACAVVNQLVELVVGPMTKYLQLLQDSLAYHPLPPMWQSGNCVAQDFLLPAPGNTFMPSPLCFGYCQSKPLGLVVQDERSEVPAL
jgi:hypothetical protein